MAIGRMYIGDFAGGVIWEDLLKIFIDLEWLMIDSTYVKVHKAGLGAKEKDQMIGRGGQYKGTYGRGCAWYAGQNYYYRRFQT